MFKNCVLAPIFNFSVHTGSRVSVSKMSYHAYDQAWAYAVWISKIRLLVLRILAKNPFPVETGSRFSATTFFHLHFDQTWTYAVWISKIRLLVLTIWAKSLFPSEPEVDFQWQQFSVITTIKPENIPFKFRKSVHKNPGYEPKTCFSRSFSIFLAKPEVDSKNERQRTLFCIKLELLAFEFWKSVH